MHMTLSESWLQKGTTKRDLRAPAVKGSETKNILLDRRQLQPPMVVCAPESVPAFVG